MLNCILWNNSDAGGTDESAQIHADAGTPLIGHSCVQGLSIVGNGNIGDDPAFDPLGGPDLMWLSPGSPRINTGSALDVPSDACDLGNGNSAEPLPIDVEGQTRAVGCVDMGAYEFQTASTIPGDLDGDGDADLDDYASFDACLTGPCDLETGEPGYADPCCAAVDFDADDCITLRDYAGFQAAIEVP